MNIPPPLPSRQASKTLSYSFYLALALIAAMTTLSLQSRAYPPSFENMAFMVVGGILGALKLQTPNT